MCEAVANKKRNYRDVTDDKFYANTSIITKKSFLRYIEGYPRQTVVPPWPPAHSAVYPKANTYYAFNEDTNPFDRFENACSESFPTNIPPHFEPPTHPFLTRDPYSEEAAKRKFLCAKPTAFVIFGKPGLNSYQLAKLIRNSWGCVLISPEDTIKQEIERKSERGLHILKILRTGDCISADLVTDLIQNRINRRDVMHRGYVLEGFPLIPNNPNVDYSFYPDISKIPEDSKSVTSSFSSTHIREPVAPISNTISKEGSANSRLLQINNCVCKDELSETSSFRDTDSPDELICGEENTYKVDITQQIDNIFTQWPIKPTVLIYVMCPKEDLASKREHFKIDPKSGERFDTNDIMINDELQNVSKTSHGGIINYGHLKRKEQNNHMLRRITDARHNVLFQCEIYEKYAIPVIDKWTILHNPQNVIRVDGRTTVTRMFEIISSRLRTLPLPRVILAKKCFEPNVNEVQVEDLARADIKLETEGKTNEEIIDSLVLEESVLPGFPLQLSRWKFLCPVELAKGRIAEGVPKYAVRFMKDIFLLSSQENADIFVENPRPFLLHGPRPTCKIAVIGPKYSGKSQLSRNLANAFEGIVISINEVEKDLEKEYISEKCSRILELIINLIKEVKENPTTLEPERASPRRMDLRILYNDILDCVESLNKMFEVRIVNDDELSDKIDKLSLALQTLRNIEGEYLKPNDTNQELMEGNITVLCVDKLEETRTEKLPTRKLTEYISEIITVVKEHSGHFYDQRIDLTTDEKINIVKRAIGMLSEEPLDEEIDRDTRFVLDDLYTDVDVWTNLVKNSEISFEHTVVIFEREPYDNLINTWIEVHGSSSHEEEYESDQGHFQKYFLDDDEQECLELRQFENLEEYINSVKQFELNWDDLRRLVEQISRHVIICDLQVVKDVSSFVIDSINDQYQVAARKMTPTEIERQFELLNMMTALQDIEALKDEVESESGENDRAEEVKEKDNAVIDIRPLGDTSIFCPVAYFGHNVFWKGMEEFSATFMHKTYLLSSADARDEFVRNPTNYSIPLLQPTHKIPPLRLSIIGPIGSGKSTIAHMLARERGLLHVDHLQRICNFVKERPMLSFKLEDFLISEEEYVEVELPGELDDERYNTDQDVVHTFIRKYLKNGDALPTKMFQECILTFFNPPYNDCGIVLNGFPSCKEDVKLALQNYTVPEVVIELKCNSQTTLQRIVPKLLTYWAQKEDEKKRAEEVRYNEELLDYLTKQKLWVAKMMKARQNERQRNIDSSAEGNSTDAYEQIEDALQDMHNIIDIDVEQAATDELELETIWQKKHPRPMLFTDWEDPDTVKKRIIQNLEELYEMHIQKISEIRQSMETTAIPWIEVDGENNKVHVLLEVLNILDRYCFRNMSILERTYTVDLETAEILLESGYYFLSSFGRFCPVQLYKQENPFGMFLQQEVKQEVVPVIHRQYIYFLGDEEAFKAFSENPLKYLEQDSSVPLIPFRISIIGPPKSGKTTLAERFARTYGLKVITPGKALRCLLKNFGWTEEARSIETTLRTGHTVSEASVAHAVELHTIDPLVASQGFVLDGYPANRVQYEELSLLGIQPMIVLDLKADLDFCLECLSSDYDESKKPSNYSSKFLSRRYAQWKIDKRQFREWLKKFAENSVELDASISKWGVWIHANRAVRSKYLDIRKYFREADYEKVHTLQHMCITPYEFKTKQSMFESYCPLCFMLNDDLIFSGPSPDRQGIVQYKDHFYWVCSKHMNDFMKNPMKYLPPNNKKQLPRDRPRALEGTVDVEHSCWTKRLRMNGLCPVTYIDNLPTRNLTPGRADLTAIYQDQLFLFCAPDCCRKFLAKPTKYSTAQIHFPCSLSLIEVGSLPILGFLEQTVANLIVKAVNEIVVQRPKLPGLSASITAAVYIGIYIKRHNPNSSPKQVAIYNKVAKRIAACNNIIETATRNMKKTLNPYIPFPKESYVVENVENRISNKSCETAHKSCSIRFHRTSPTQTLVDPDE